MLEDTKAYITIKDYKSEFPNKIPCRLINPSKSSIGKISKVILDRINEKIISSVTINQWKNTSAFLKWYSKIASKTEWSLIQFDIDSFYPSITRGPINKVIEFAKTIVDIPDEDLSIIMESRKTLLFNEKVPWVKKERDEDFDVPMGYYDDAEVCEITRSYILNWLSDILDKDLVGLYKDDRLAIVRYLSGPEIEMKRKAMIKVFKECGLDITIQTNLKIVNFRDVEMNLDTGIYRSYRKPDKIPVYINRKSNHHPYYN